ncbi:MAG: hypothetical protein PUE21_01310 [Lachnospiraceae bacterium]|nr:hypothetical protein [Lachnospiraceae bacterium]
MKKKILLLALVVILCFGGCNFHSSRNHTSEPVDSQDVSKETESESESVEKIIISEGEINPSESLENENKNETDGVKLIKQGYEFVIPSEYGIAFMDNGEAILYMNDLFQLRPVVISEDQEKYDSYKDDPSVLMQKALDQGGEIIHDIKYDEVNGIGIYHFGVDLSGDTCEILRTRLSETESLGVNIVVQGNLSDDDCLNIVAALAASAVKTDKPDTTEDEIIGNSYKPSGEERTEGTIGEEVVVTHKVAEGFLFKNHEEEPKIRDNYYRYTYANGYDILFVKLIKDGTAESYIKTQSNQYKTIDVNGQSYYYVEEVEDTEEYYCKSFVAATDVGGGWIYIVDLESAEEFEMDYIKKFMEIEVQ